MKTSKILLSALVGVMAVGGASALTTDEIMARCNSSKDTVWDSFNKTCVPRNPCKKDGYARYCNKEFESVQVNSVDDGKTLARAYAMFTDGQMARCEALANPGIVGQDYLGCTYDNGHYVVFEFDDLSQHGSVVLPSKLTEMRTSGEYGCYGYKRDEDHDKAKIGQFVKSPILPNSLCFVSQQTTDFFQDNFCFADKADTAAEVFQYEDLISRMFKIIYGDKLDTSQDNLFVDFTTENSPDGTSVRCASISANGLI